MFRQISPRFFEFKKKDYCHIPARTRPYCSNLYSAPFKISSWVLDRFRDIFSGVGQDLTEHVSPGADRNLVCNCSRRIRSCRACWSQRRMIPWATDTRNLFSIWPMNWFWRSKLFSTLIGTCSSSWSLGLHRLKQFLSVGKFKNGITFIFWVLGCGGDFSLGFKKRGFLILNVFSIL